MGGGPRSPGHGGRRSRADRGAAGLRRAARSRQRPGAANRAGVGARGGRARGARGPGPGAGALRGPSGGQVPGEDRRGGGPGRGRGVGAASPAGIRSCLQPRARGAGSARRGLRRSPSARRCGDVRRRRDRAAPRARQSRPYTDTKCLRGKLQARDAGGGGAEATDRLTAAGEPHSSSDSKKPPASRPPP